MKDNTTLIEEIENKIASEAIYDADKYSLKTFSHSIKLDVEQLFSALLLNIILRIDEEELDHYLIHDLWGLRNSLLTELKGFEHKITGDIFK